MAPYITSHALSFSSPMSICSCHIHSTYAFFPQGLMNGLPQLVSSWVQGDLVAPCGPRQHVKHKEKKGNIWFLACFLICPVPFSIRARFILRVFWAKSWSFWSLLYMRARSRDLSLRPSLKHLLIMAEVITDIILQAIQIICYWQFWNGKHSIFHSLLLDTSSYNLFC